MYTQTFQGNDSQADREFPKWKLLCASGCDSTQVNMGWLNTGKHTLETGRAQSVECPTEKPDATFMQVRVTAAARDFSSTASFQCRLSYDVHAAPCVQLHASTSVCMLNPEHWQPHHCLDTRKILRTLTGMGSAALAAAIPYPGKATEGDPNFTWGAMKYFNFFLNLKMRRNGITANGHTTVTKNTAAPNVRHFRKQEETTFHTHTKEAVYKT